MRSQIRSPSISGMARPNFRRATETVPTDRCLPYQARLGGAVTLRPAAGHIFGDTPDSCAGAGGGVNEGE